MEITTPLFALVLYHLLPISEILYLQHLSCTLPSHQITFKLVLWRDEDISSFCGKIETIIIPPISKTEEHNSNIASIDDARVALLLQDASHLHGLDILAKLVSDVDIVLVGEYIHQSQYQFLIYLYSAIPNRPPWIIFSLNGFAEAYHHFEGKAPSYSAIHSYFEYILPFLGFGSSKDDIITLKGYLNQKRKFGWTVSKCTPHNQGCEWRRVHHITKRYLLQKHASQYLVQYSKFIKNHSIVQDHTGSVIDFTTRVPIDDCAKHLGADGFLVTQSTKRSSGSSSSLLCLLYTTHKDHPSHPPPLHAIVDTWAPHCDGFLAFSDKTDSSLGAISMTEISKMIETGKKIASGEELDESDGLWSESYYRMWNKAQAMWSVVATSELIDVYDYFFIGGDDVYLVPENLKLLLSKTEFRSSKFSFLDQTNLT